MIFNDTLIRAVSWTLVHSLWQGILLAFCAGIVILLTKKSGAAMRYHLLSGLFFLFLAVVGLTFYYEFTPIGTETVTRLDLIRADEPMPTAISTLYTTDFSILFIDFFNRQAGWIAMIWFLVFAVKFIGIFHSLNHVYRIRNYRTFAPSDYWIQRVSALAQQIQIRKPVVLLESALVKIPSVTGFFKPMILIPVGLLSNLPQDQVEAILLHELAHIRRKDYAINILQHVAEMIFFFNPGLLWLSSLIRSERENCCDDIALGVIKNKAGFVQALVSFEEYQLNSQLAIGFAGKRNHLLARAKRIIYNDNPSLNAIEKTFLSMGLLFIAVIVVACSNSLDRTSHQTEFAMGDVPTEIAIPKADSIRLAKTDSIARQADRRMAVVDSLAAIEDVRIAKEDARIAKEDSRIATQDAQIAAEDARQAAADAKLKKEPNSKITRTVTSKTRTDNATETTYREEESNGKKVSLRTGISGDDLPQNIDTNNITNNLTSDLIAENIISNTKNLSYKLSRNSLVVNGVLQPERSFRKLRDKYLKNQFHAICYNYEVEGDIRKE